VRRSGLGHILDVGPERLEELTQTSLGLINTGSVTVTAAVQTGHLAVGERDRGAGREERVDRGQVHQIAPPRQLDRSKVVETLAIRHLPGKAQGALNVEPPEAQPGDRCRPVPRLRADVLQELPPPGPVAPGPDQAHPGHPVDQFVGLPRRVPRLERRVGAVHVHGQGLGGPDRASDTQIRHGTSPSND
jgi:hypothetical protein